MKTTQKQRETSKSGPTENLVDASTIVTEGTKKNRVKKNGKRIHSRSFYMAINPKGGAMANKKQLPVFWKKSLAKEVASKVNGKAVKVTVSW